jgi:oligopeptide transport system ATP-binding protein
MYGGYIIEEAEVKDLYAHPSHPYTVGLIGSLPRLDAKQDEKLYSIEGFPPVLYNKPTACPFAPRCNFVQDICWKTNPKLEEIRPNHYIACWVDMKTGSVRK